jgi:DNA-binding CsgD family transcriptional regulator
MDRSPEMLNSLPSLPAEFLNQLSLTLANLGPVQGGVGFVSLVNLAHWLPDAASITVDFTKVRQLAAPLIVVRVADRTRDDRAWHGLTPRERQVAQLLAAGLANKVIARDLCVTLGTVKDHVHRILAKTGHRSRAAFAADCCARPERAAS